jgi:hypothetical protein
MLKNILKLDGAQQLSKNEQKTINGGKIRCTDSYNGPCLQTGIKCAEERCRVILLDICIVDPSAC